MTLKESLSDGYALYYVLPGKIGDVQSNLPSAIGLLSAVYISLGGDVLLEGDTILSK